MNVPESQENSIPRDDEDMNLLLQKIKKTSKPKLTIELLKLAYPFILCEISQSLLLIVSTGFVDNLGKKDLAAMALAQTWFSICNVTSMGL
ncbi:hypothetical protein ACHAWO_009703 [Cyclotella atomus]|uniref:Uncharacterized protein n=1 Tax=Cyclotella atomus TaxID=382360 RepID=A0ABD3NT93_9STRA